MGLNQSIVSRVGRFAPRIAGLALCAGVAMAAMPARALVIDVTYGTDGSIVPVAAQTAFNNDILLYENLFTNNITVNIAFNWGTSGLGGSSTAIVTGISYSNWRAAVAANAAANPTNTIEATGLLDNLPVSDPFAGGQVTLRTADARALGFTGAVFNPAFDSTITINGNQPLDYGNTPIPGDYNFSDVATHELDEALGIGSELNGPNDQALPTNNFEAEDYFRYACGSTSRDISTSAGANVCFSYDGGLNDIAQFNQDNNAAGNNGADRNDWFWPGSCALVTNPLVQDAITCQDQVGPLMAVGTPEFDVLSALGYDPTAAAPAVPEPSTLLLLLSGGLLAFAAARRHAALQD